jgi:hypothetical protein
MRRRTNEPLARTLRQRADFTIAIGSSTSTTQLIALGIEVEETAMYEVLYSSVIHIGSGTAQNESNIMLVLDGMKIRGRGCWETLHSSVPGRFTISYRIPVLLSEGGHYLTVEGWSFNSAGTIINGSFELDCQSLEIFKL